MECCIVINCTDNEDKSKILSFLALETDVAKTNFTVAKDLKQYLKEYCKMEVVEQNSRLGNDPPKENKTVEIPQIQQPLSMDDDECVIIEKNDQVPVKKTTNAQENHSGSLEAAPVTEQPSTSYQPISSGFEESKNGIRSPMIESLDVVPISKNRFNLTSEAVEVPYFEDVKPVINQRMEGQKHLENNEPNRLEVEQAGPKKEPAKVVRRRMPSIRSFWNKKGRGVSVKTGGIVKKRCMLTCQKCGFKPSMTCRSYDKLCRHASSHTDLIRYKCDVNGCSYKQRTPQFANHFVRDHPNQKGLTYSSNLTKEEETMFAEKVAECFPDFKKNGKTGTRRIRRMRKN